MSTKPADDFDAVRAIVDALGPFDSKDQERIIRWAREKVGLAVPVAGHGSPEPPSPDGGQSSPNLPTDAASRSKDIRSFVDSKKPQSDNQFAATVAYYYRFEAPEAEKKLDIAAEDLQDAARKTGRDRFTRPAQTLLNAHGQGYFDKADRGHYALNTVGENLVAMALPQGAGVSPRRPPSQKRRVATKSKKRIHKKTK